MPVQFTASLKRILTSFVLPPMYPFIATGRSMRKENECDDEIETLGLGLSANQVS